MKSLKEARKYFKILTNKAYKYQKELGELL